jgi:hypothetical protein
MAANMEDVQTASDNAQAGLEPSDDTQPEEGNTIEPQSSEATKQKIRDVFDALDTHKQDRKTANEHLSALREDLVSLGFSKKAQSTVAAYMKLNEDDQTYFDESVSIMRNALGKPMQGSLELVHSAD